MPNSLKIYADEYDGYSWTITNNDGFQDFVEASNGKGTEYNAPAGYKYKSLRFPFKWDAVYKRQRCKTMHSVGLGSAGNLLDMEEWLEHPTVKAFFDGSNPRIDEIVYYDASGSKEITEEDAFAISRLMDVANKPKTVRPGKKRAEPASPATSTATKSAKPPE